MVFLKKKIYLKKMADPVLDKWQKYNMTIDKTNCFIDEKIMINRFELNLQF